jgi:hypothetical protein
MAIGQFNGAGDARVGARLTGRRPSDTLNSKRHSGFGDCNAARIVPCTGASPVPYPLRALPTPP